MTELSFGIPSTEYDLRNFSDETLPNFSRLLRLVKHTLGSLDSEIEYELFGEMLHYGLGETEAGSHYGIQFHSDVRIFIVFSTQRDIAYPMALFPTHRAHAACDYFVWLVSKGKREIDWSLFLDMTS